MENIMGKTEKITFVTLLVQALYLIVSVYKIISLSFAMKLFPIIMWNFYIVVQIADLSVLLRSVLSHTVVIFIALSVCLSFIAYYLLCFIVSYVYDKYINYTKQVINEMEQIE